MKWFKGVILFLVSLFTFLVLLIETPPGQALVKQGLLFALKRSGVHIEAGALSGKFPEEIELTDVHIEGIGDIQKVNLKLSLLPLFSGQIRVDKINADGVTIVPKADEKTLTEESSKIPFSINLRHYHLTHVRWKDLPEFEVKGAFRTRRRGKAAFLKATVKQYDSPESVATATIRRDRFGKMEGDLTLFTPTLTTLKPWLDTFNTTVDGALQLHVHAKGTLAHFTGMIKGQFHDTALNRDWAFKSRIRKEKRGPFQLQRLIASTLGLRIQGSLDLDESGNLKKADGKLRVELDSFTPLGGTVFGDAHLKKTACGLETQVNWQSDKVTIDGTIASKSSGSIHGLLGERSFVGSLAAQTEALQTAWTLKSDVTFRREAPLLFENASIDSELLVAKGNLSLRPDACWIGKIAIEYANLAALPKINPNLPFSGIVQGTISLSAAESSQQINVDLTARGLSYKEISTSAAKISGNVQSFTVEMEGIQWKTFRFDTATLTSNDRHFLLSLGGDLMQCNMAGDWAPNYLSFQTVAGKFLHHSFTLLQPSTIKWSPNDFSWDRLYLSLGAGTIDGTYLQEKEKKDAKITLQQVPLDILSLNPLQTRVDGAFDARFQFQQKGKSTDADWTFSVQNGALKAEGQTPITAVAKGAGHLHKDALSCQANVDIDGRPFFKLDVNLPMHVGTDGHISFPGGRTAGSLAAHGKIEDLLNFFNLGMHRLEGDVSCDLTLKHGQIEGTCNLIDGYYQNYLTGTELTHISAQFLGEGHGLTLKSLTAQDRQKKGELSATGHIHCSLEERFPFHFDVEFTRMNLVQIDLISADAQGRIWIDGNFQSGIASGEVSIVESDIAIPSHIPRSYPDLQVVYKHRPIPVGLSQRTPKPPYPLQLDFKIRAPDSIYIGGRGVTSEWKGDFAVGGTYAEPAILGKLELIDGEFVFAGHRFKLENGSLTLKGNQYQMPLIDISATTTEKAVSITARLKGPLSQPQLTFQSVPPLPLSGILSFLLFGKDLSEVSGLQALQLAGTVASVAGEGPDILEITRKSLGVDRLQIVMTPKASGEGYEGNETIALQVGKVITPGIIVTIRQSANDSSPDIGVEIDLTHGFTFEAESQQEPEQGKFSLKWNLNY